MERLRDNNFKLPLVFSNKPFFFLYLFSILTHRFIIIFTYKYILYNIKFYNLNNIKKNIKRFFNIYNDDNIIKSFNYNIKNKISLKNNFFLTLIINIFLIILIF